MKTYIGSKYDWDSVVTIMGKDDTPESVGKQIARGFTRFSKNREMSGMETGEKFIFREAFTIDAKPLNYHLLDDDALVILKKMFSEASLEEMKTKDEPLKDFFGSADEGRAVLETLDSDEWEDLLG